MIYEEIQADLQSLVRDMMDKGVKQPRADLTIKDHGKPSVALWCSTEAMQFDGDYLYQVFGDTPSDAITRARSFIALLPDPAIEGQRKYTKKLAEAVDIATEYALPDEAVAPVRAAIREVNALFLAGPA